MNFSELLFKEISKEDESKLTSEDFVDLFEKLVNFIEMSLTIFNSIVIRYYEKDILSEQSENRKKSIEIKELLSKKYNAPSLGTHINLAKKCFTLIGSQTPVEINNLKKCLQGNIDLKEIGNLLEDLSDLLSHINEEDDDINITTQPRTINRYNSRLPLLNSVIDEFRVHRNESAHFKSIGRVIKTKLNEYSPKYNNWVKGYNLLHKFLSPIWEIDIVSQKVGIIKEKGDRKEIQIIKKTYGKNDTITETQFIDFNTWKLTEWSSKIEVILAGNVVINLFPFLLIDGDDLCFFKKTDADVYRYYNIKKEKSFSYQTKKKFNYSVFTALPKSPQQELFWNEYRPRFNSNNTIKSNVPFESVENFIGRNKQIKTVFKQVIELTNKDGIIYGNGGIGKTALLIEICKKIFEGKIEDITFDDIIWTSAKLDFYNPAQSFVQKKPMQINSLESIFDAILSYYEREEFFDYELEDKKNLVLGYFESTKILLLIDNCETLNKNNLEEIIYFFQYDVKQHLKKKPDNLKIIITTREIIPSGFNPIQLLGLDLREAKKLMRNILKKYKHGNNCLTEVQLVDIHDFTKGSPVIMEHVLCRFYEFNESFDSIKSSLTKTNNVVIEFSYKEILNILKKDNIILNIFLLLEYYGKSLSINQVSRILKIERTIVEDKFRILLNFLCVERSFEGNSEKYVINRQIDLLIKSLYLENLHMVEELQNKFRDNYNIQESMDYSEEEKIILKLFEFNLKSSDIRAEMQLKAETERNPKYYYLRYKYAEFLKCKKKRIKDCLEILIPLNDEIQKSKGKEILILKTIAECYLEIFPIDYTNVEKYYNEIINETSDEKIIIEIVEFYLKWAKKVETINKDQAKSNGYKALEILSTNMIRDSNKYSNYLLASSYYHVEDYINALKYANVAYKVCKTHPNFPEINRLKQNLEDKRKDKVF